MWRGHPKIPVSGEGRLLKRRSSGQAQQVRATCERENLPGKFWTRVGSSIITGRTCGRRSLMGVSGRARLEGGKGLHGLAEIRTRDLCRERAPQDDSSRGDGEYMVVSGDLAHDRRLNRPTGLTHGEHVPDLRQVRTSRRLVDRPVIRRRIQIRDEPPPCDAVHTPIRITGRPRRSVQSIRFAPAVSAPQGSARGIPLKSYACT